MIEPHFFKNYLLFYNKHILNKEQNNQVKKEIEIIYYSAKVLEYLYLSNMEKKNNQMIYDYILNKEIIKYCLKIIELILNYNKILLLQKISTSKTKENENIFEVSFPLEV